MPNYHFKNGITHSDTDIEELLKKYPHKYLWFAQNGYKPHYWQLLFHSNTDPEKDKLCRFRHLVAGRRGGKTLSAAWEVIFYALHPEAFHLDLHGREDTRPLHIWVVTQDYPMGMAALLAVRQVLEAAGLEHGKEFKENRGNRWFEFENGSFLQFKTADNPESLRGAGLDIMWYDEAAFISTERAWEVSRPALSNLMGMFVSTTTPIGKNWFYREFWRPEVIDSANQGRVEYRSIDSPYFPREEWEEAKRTMHPLVFKTEMMASFDAMAGKELAGDWLHYYEIDEIEQYMNPDGSYHDLQIYIAVDPAISLADTADRFAITAIGVTSDRHAVYLLDQWAGRIPFPEQVDKINTWFHKYRPHGIGIEKTAYQAALAQQVQRLEGLPPVIALWARGKKFERILSMAPLFRIGKVKIRRDHMDFIDEWINYDSTKKNPEDDCLDSMEMALRMTGAILPYSPREAPPFQLEGASKTALDWETLVADRANREKHYDEHMGGEW